METGERLVAYLLYQLNGILYSPSSNLSVWALLAALLIAAGWYCVSKRRLIRLAVLRRALFPRRLITGRSAKADWAMTGMSYFVFSTAWLTGIINLPLVSSTVQHWMAGWTGTATAFSVSPTTGRILTTMAGFLAYELIYYVDHWIKHRVPFFWHFHKVHHTAETLSPLTVFRMHPIDGYSFFALKILAIGAAIGLCLWAFGPAASPYLVDGMNVVLFGFFYLLMTLHHSQVWIPFRGWLGQTILSPAHHQIHHSMDPRDFDSNFGNVLAIWDRLFGTLKIPERRSPRLRFGVGGLNHDPHSFTGMLLAPIGDALRIFLPRRAGDAAPATAA